MKKLLLILLVATITTNCSKKIISIEENQIKDYESLLNNYNNIFEYSLPKTVIKLQIPISVNKYEKGLVEKHSADTTFSYKFFRNFYGFEKTKETDKFSLDQKVLVTPITVPDPSKKFHLYYKSSKAISQTLNISLTKDGIIQSGEFAQESKTFEIISKSFEIAGPLIGAMLPLGNNDFDPNNFLNTEFKKSLDQISKDNIRILKLCLDLNNLYNMRSGLLNNLGNSVNTTEILKMYLSEIDSQITKIKNELMGNVKKKIHYLTFYLDITKEADTVKLFSLNPKSGIFSIDDNFDLSQVSPDLRSSIYNKKENKDFILNLKKLSVQNPVKIEATNVTELPNSFLHYNIPAKFEISIKFDNKKLSTFGSKDQKEGADDFQIFLPQLGTVGVLPTDFKEANIVYFEDTGGIKSIKYSKASEIDAEKLGTLYNSLDSLKRSLKKGNDEKSNNPSEDVIVESTIPIVIK